MSSKRTTHIRVDRELVKYWDVAFPDVSKSNVVKMAWNTSLLKAEANLKDKDFKNKFGKFLYGDIWKDE